MTSIFFLSQDATYALLNLLTTCSLFIVIFGLKVFSKTIFAPFSGITAVILGRCNPQYSCGYSFQQWRVQALTIVATLALKVEC
jgi:hypothetical protein